MRGSECAVVRQGHLIAVVATFLIGCAVLLLGVGCAGTSSQTSEKEQEPTEATKKEQTRLPEATASEEEARCEGTRTFNDAEFTVATNDLPGCPKGGLLLGTDKPSSPSNPEWLAGKGGDDEIRGLGGSDFILGGGGKDVIYGGDGHDFLSPGKDGHRDEVHCGKGKDEALVGTSADKIDRFDNSCEVKAPTGGPVD